MTALRAPPANKALLFVNMLFASSTLHWPSIGALHSKKMAPALAVVSVLVESADVAEFLAKVQFPIWVLVGFTRYIAPPKPKAVLSENVEFTMLAFELSLSMSAAPSIAVRLENSHWLIKTS